MIYFPYFNTKYTNVSKRITKKPVPFNVTSVLIIKSNTLMYTVRQFGYA